MKISGKIVGIEYAKNEITVKIEEIHVSKIHILPPKDIILEIIEKHPKNATS